MFGGRASKIVANAKKGGAAEVTPIIIPYISGRNYGGYYEEDETTSIGFASDIIQITNINTTIILELDSENQFFSTYRYKVSSNPNDLEPYGGTDSGGNYSSDYFSPISISNNQYLSMIPSTNYNTIYADVECSLTSYTLNLRNVSDNNNIVFQWPNWTTQIFGPPYCCFLTTVLVEFLGLPDDSPELTNMRILRNHYKEQDEFLIKEYSRTSPKIIQNINKSSQKSQIYLYIYEKVKICQNLIEQNNYEEARRVYLLMYNFLKESYL
jgi:hypothetical protein